FTLGQQLTLGQQPSSGQPGQLTGQPSGQQDHVPGNWNMDTCASSYHNDSLHSLSDVLNMCIYPSVSIGDGYSINFTNSGLSILPTPHQPLHLNNDFMTRRVLLRCDSIGYLYPVMKPSTILDAFLTKKLLVLCHACQLAKHVRLPFVSSIMWVKSCFDVVHSVRVMDFPILSLSGFNTMFCS
nr:hypothetical protein [Tanacetum cinerariifolium]